MTVLFLNGCIVFMVSHLANCDYCEFAHYNKQFAYYVLHNLRTGISHN